MGQILCIEMQDEALILAIGYYHWSAYTESALELVELMLHGASQLYSEDNLQWAVSLLEATGAGVTPEERQRIENNLSKFLEMDFKSAIDRNEGLLAVTDEGIKELAKEADDWITIHLDNRTVDFNVARCYLPGEYEEEFETDPADIELVEDFSFGGIPFESFSNLRELFYSHKNGVRFIDGTVILWAE